MKLCALLLLALVASDAAQGAVDPRGARPVAPNTRSEKCDAQKEWPFCTDEEWGPKCPSGCRIHGLMEKIDHEFLKRIEKIKSLLDQNKAKHRSMDDDSKQTHNYLREKLTVSTGLDNNYFDMAQVLRTRITEMKIKIDQQLQILGALKEKVKEQVNDMHRLEVDIDMKLRSCKGSCKTYHSHEVEHEGHVALEKQMNQLDTLSGQTVETVGTLHVMKSRPLKDAVVDSVFKSKDVHAAPQTTEDLFPMVNTMQLFLEVEGSSSSSPATVSKVPGTSLSPDPSSSSSSGSSPSSSGSSHTSITELGGGGMDPFGDPFGGTFEFLGQSGASTKSVSCTKRLRTVVVDTGDGPVTKTEEFMEGGPECQTLGTGTAGTGFSSFTDSGTKTVHFTSSKGSLSDAKTSFADPFADTGVDLGAFMTDNAEDDLPDVHARSAKSARVERQADYVGKVCLRLSQNGRQSPPRSDRKQNHCRRKTDVPLCSDHDSESRCPSGCRLQGLMLDHEATVENKLRDICKKSKTFVEAAEKAMATTAKVYHRSREVIVSQSAAQEEVADAARDLTKNLTLLQKRSEKLEQQASELRENIQHQLENLLRTEVEVGMTLRSCLGSCRSGQVLPSATEDLALPLLQTPLPRSRHAPLIVTAPADFGPEPLPFYKSIRTVLREGLDLFENLQTPRLQLHEEGEESEL